MSLANQCPERKRIRKEKLKQTKMKKSLTYADISGQHQKQPTIALPQVTQPLIKEETSIKIMQCILHAHFMNAANPGAYENELNKIFIANGLPTIKVLNLDNVIQNISSMTTYDQTSEKDDDDDDENEEESSDTVSENDSEDEDTPSPARQLENKPVTRKSNHQGKTRPIQIKNLQRNRTTRTPFVAITPDPKSSINVQHTSPPNPNKKKGEQHKPQRNK